jgi:AraC-like DNA-binding protein
MSQAFWSDPALPFVESRRAQHSRACYRPHSPPSLSIGAVDAGHSTLAREGGQPLRLAAGDLVVIAPHQVHACNPDLDGEWSYQMLYLDACWLSDLLGEMPGQGIEYPAGRCSAEAYQRFCRLNTELFSPLDAEYKESLLIEYIGQLLAVSWSSAATRPPNWLPDILDVLRQQCEQSWPVAQLAARAGLSRYHFIRAFHNHTGMTPHAFQLDSRINRARSLLRSGCPLAELAQSLGFSDQSHFHHAFKQRVAVTPRQFLALQAH